METYIEKRRVVRRDPVGSPRPEDRKEKGAKERSVGGVTRDQELLSAASSNCHELHGVQSQPLWALLADGLPINFTESSGGALKQKQSF